MTNLIVLEGIDCSGKTTIAKRLAKDLGYQFEHEPTFSSEEADRLNFSTLDCWQREYQFLIDRYNHQYKLKTNVILDSYILRGIVYAKTFGKEPESGWVSNMCRSIYSLQDFRQPNFTIFIDQEPYYAFQINSKKKDSNPKLSCSILNDLRFNYLQELLHFKPHMIVNPIQDDMDATYELVKIYVQSFLRRQASENKSTG